MIPSTSPIVSISSPRSPCSDRSAASIAYATDDTGSPITAKANASSRISRLEEKERCPAGVTRRWASMAHLLADQSSRHSSGLGAV